MKKIIFLIISACLCTPNLSLADRQDYEEAKKYQGKPMAGAAIAVGSIALGVAMAPLDAGASLMLGTGALWGGSLGQGKPGYKGARTVRKIFKQALDIGDCNYFTDHLGEVAKKIGVPRANLKQYLATTHIGEYNLDNFVNKLYVLRNLINKENSTSSSYTSSYKYASSSASSTLQKLIKEKKERFEKVLVETWAAGDAADISKLKNLLTKDSSNYQTKDDNWTALMIYAGLGKVKGTAAAIRHAKMNGADPTIKDNRGWTALHWAAYYGNAEAAKELSKSPWLLKLINKEWRTPCMIAIREGHEEVANILLQATKTAAEKPNQDSGSFGLDTLFNDNLPSGKYSALEKIMLDTWEAGDSADISELRSKLTKKNCNYQTKDDKWTPLMFFAGLKGVKGTAGAIRHAKFIGADAAIKDNKGWTALHWAAYYGNAEAARELVKDDLLLELRNEEGHTPLQTAELEGFEKVARILGKKFNVTEGSSQNTKPEKKIYLPDDAYMKKMKAKHKLSDEKEGTLEKAILETWSAGDAANVISLIMKMTKNNCNYQTKDDKWTPIMILAGLKGAKSIDVAIQEAIDLGADPAIKDDQGWNALHWSAYYDNAEAARELAENRSLLNATDYSGLTPLRTAELEGHEVVAEILRKASIVSDVPATGNEGDSAYDNNGFSDDEDSYNGFSDDDDENDENLTVFELIDSENITGLSRFVSSFSSANDMNQAFKDEMKEKGENSLKYAIRVKNTAAVRIIGEKAESLKILTKKKLEKYINDSM